MNGNNAMNGNNTINGNNNTMVVITTHKPLEKISMKTN